MDWWPREQTEAEKEEERELKDRSRLIDHIRWELLFHRPVEFIDQLAQAIELAAAGETDAWIEVERGVWRVGELLEFWWLDEFVERTRAGEFKPNRDPRSWRCDAPRQDELLTESEAG